MTTAAGDRAARRGRSLPREAGLAIAVTAALTLAIYGPFVPRAGILLDDWGFVARFWAFDSGHPLRVAWDAIDSRGGDRPVGWFFFGLVYRTLGDHQAAYLVLLGVLAFAVSVLLYAVLRLVGLGVVGALAVAALTELVPLSDAIRLWPAAGIAQVSLVLLLGGLTVALVGADRRGRGAVALHAVAAALYAASALTYETTVALVPLLFLLYRTRTGWRPALARGAADWAVAALVAVWIASHTVKHATGTGALTDRLHLLAIQVGQAFASLETSVGSAAGDTRVSIWVVRGAVVVVAAIAASGIVRRRRAEPGSDLRRELGRWLAVGAAGALVIAAGHAVTFVAGGYSPVAAGIYNRVNAVAAIGYVLVTLAAGMVAVFAVLGDRFTPRRASLAAAGIALVLGGLYAVRLAEHQSQYARAHDWEGRVLAAYRTGIARPPPGTTIFSFGAPRQAAPDVPVFEATWDLTGALRVLWHDRSVRAAPGGGMRALRCSADRLVPVGFLYGPSWSTPYPSALLVNVAERRALRVRDRQGCERWVGRWFDPQPVAE